jgi:hypothetical protein
MKTGIAANATDERRVVREVLEDSPVRVAAIDDGDHASILVAIKIQLSAHRVEELSTLIREGLLTATATVESHVIG